MKRIRIATWVAVAVLVAVVGLAFLLRPGISNLQVPPMPLSARIGGPFELTTQEGKRLSSAELAGQPFVVFFGYTHCPDVCPTTMLELSNLIERLGPDADRMRYFFITVDSERDTPEQLKLYLSNFDRRITGLTGTSAEIVSAAKAYGVFYQKVPTKNGYTYNHTAQIYLMGRDGRLAGTLAPCMPGQEGGPVCQESDDVQLKKLRRLIGQS